MQYCPLCNSVDIGKVGTNQYYCWHCLIEFAVRSGEINIYYVEDDGSLLSLDTNYHQKKQLFTP